MSDVTTLVNGLAVDCLSTQDRGLLYGDGLFETIAVQNGTPRHWTRHLDRLQDGCARLGIAPPDAAVLESEAASLCRGAVRAVLKLIVTRGRGGRGYRPDPEAPATRIVQLHPYPSWPAENARDGVRVRICRLRLGCNPLLAGIKHLNRLEQVLARAEWDDPTISEGLMLDASGHLIEGTMSNVFLVRDGVLQAPDLVRCGVAGITRALTLQLARQASIATAVRDITVDELDGEGTEEIFLCNSLIGIWPVIRVADRPYPVGNMTRFLQACLRDHVDDERRPSDDRT